MTDIERLRSDLLAAVNAVFDKWSSDDPAEGGAGDLEQISVLSELDEWIYRWPDNKRERYETGRAYRAKIGDRTHDFRVGWTVRRAWGKDRGRAVVFLDSGRPVPQSHYPLTEFVETDDGRMAAAIPRPSQPRASLTDGDLLPPGFDNLDVERSDALYGMENGPSLRVVVNPDDELSMVKHGWWVGVQRGRI